MSEAIRSIGVTEVTYYLWWAGYGGLKGDQVKRLKELDTDNARLRRAASDLTLYKMILAEAARGNFQAPPAAVPVWTMYLQNWVCANDGHAGFSARIVMPIPASRWPDRRTGSLRI